MDHGPVEPVHNAPCPCSTRRRRTGVALVRYSTATALVQRVRPLTAARPPRRRHSITVPHIKATHPDLPHTSPRPQSESRECSGPAGGTRCPHTSRRPRTSRRTPHPRPLHASAGAATVDGDGRPQITPNHHAPAAPRHLPRHSPRRRASRPAMPSLSRAGDGRRRVTGIATRIATVCASASVPCRHPSLDARPRLGP